MFYRIMQLPKTKFYYVEESELKHFPYWNRIGSFYWTPQEAQQLIDERKKFRIGEVQ